MLQSEVADVIWRFDEPAARSVFRLAFDAVRQAAPNDPSSIDANAKKESAKQSRRCTSAIKTILKRYGLHDRQGAEAWLNEFESEIKAERTTKGGSERISQAQGELLCEMALGVLSQEPKEAQRLGLLALTAEEVPTGFNRLLMALRSRDKTLSDVLFRQAFFEMRRRSFNYDNVLVSLTNYAFFSNGRAFPDVSAADVRLAAQYFVDAASAQVARYRSALPVASDKQTSNKSFYIFLANRAMPIVAVNTPDQMALLQNNIGVLAQGLGAEERQEAELVAAMASQNSAPSDGDSDIDARIHRAEQEKNSSTRNLLLRNLVIWLMRSDPEHALEVARKIDDADERAHTEDDVYLVMLQKVFWSASYEKARTLALKMNDVNSRAKWLAEIATQVSSRSRDRTEITNLLSEAYSIAAKTDNTPAKMDVLLSIAKEYLRLDRDRGFEIFSDAIKTGNRLDTKTEAKPDNRSGVGYRVINITVVNGNEVSTDDRVTLDSINFNQIGAFAERDFLETSLMGTDLKDRSLRARYFIALARSVLKVPRTGPGYERTLEDLISR